MQAALISSQQGLFDYDALEVIHRLPIQQAEGEIATLFHRSVRNFIKIGQKLREVHHRFSTVDLFSAWFEARFGQSQRTAYNLMKLADKFKDADDDVIAKIGLSTLYELAAASVPESARQSALQLAGDGHQVTPEIADALIEQAKQEEATAQSDLFAAEPEPEQAAEIAQDATADDEKCLCGHGWDDHEDASDCKFCNCKCYQTERADHSNVETLAEVTETTTTKTQTKAIVEAAPDPIAQMKGEADILFNAATINLAITIFPQKSDDRDCMVWLKSGEVSVQSMCKYSQIQDALATFTLAQQMLALKVQLYENAEAKKKAGKTPVTTAKASTKTTKTSTTKAKGTK